MIIVTHRFRGFSNRENSYAGFKHALEAGVMAFEFDVRLTSDVVPVINHDRSLTLPGCDQFDIVTNTFHDLIDSAGGSDHLLYIMSLADALELFSQQKQDKSKIFIDIKDFGEEESILEMINGYSLNESIVIFSWLPEVLFAVHKLDPDIPLCFSHNYIRSTLQFDLMKEFLSNRAIKHIIGSMTSVVKPDYANELKKIDFFFEDYNRREEVPARDFSTNRDFEHTLNGPVSGRLNEIIDRSNGYLCIQYRMLGNDYAGLYSKLPQVIPYSVNDIQSLEKLPRDLACPYILSDNPEMVSRF